MKRRRDRRLAQPLVGCALLIAAYVSVVAFEVTARRPALLDPDTAACKVWAEEIWRFGRAYYSVDPAAAVDYRLVMPSVPKPAVIGVALMLRPMTASSSALRMLSVAAWGFTLWGFCALWKPRGFASALLLVLPAGLSALCIDWAASAQASTLYLAFAVGALVCFGRASEGLAPWSYAGGFLLLLAGLTRPGAWLFPVPVAIGLLKWGRLPKVHAVLGPCIGFLSPILWGAADYAFSGDPLWSAHTAGPWLPERPLAGLETLGLIGAVGLAVVRNYRQLASEVGYPLLAVALAGMVLLMLRSFGSRLLVALVGAELLVFTVIVATGVGLPATRYVAVFRLTVLLAAGGAASLCCAVVGKRNRVLGLILGGALAALVTLWFGGDARAALTDHKRFASRELEFSETADALSPRIREGDLVFVPLKFIPVLAERLQLYPMAAWFRDADLVLDVNATFRQVPSGWLVVSERRHPDLRDRIRLMGECRAAAPLVFCERLRGGIEIYQIRGRAVGAVTTREGPRAGT